AMVVGMTSDRKLIMIRQYRYLVGGEVIEFPSGSLREKEKVEDGLKREFEEETGYNAMSLQKLCAVYETYGQLNRKIHIYFAPNVVKTKQHLDRGEEGYEDIKVELVDFEKAVELALKNKIVAMGSTLAILFLQEKIRRGEVKL
ncbi:MAG: NUDIX hydrolase, partial [Patescibacteria group bacterium]|nr:NUDIX hydrolase [Patescibacteria group bacterium]